MAVVTIKRVDGILELVRANVPRPVDSVGDFEDLEVAAPALISIAADLFRGIVGSSPPDSRVRAEVMARSLAEYAIGFAWLVAPANADDRKKRMRQFVKDEFREREKAENKLRQHLGTRSIYAPLLDPDREGPLPRELLDEHTRARLASLKADKSIEQLPGAFDMAFAADERWMPEIDLVQHNPFALIYFTLFTGPSFLTHPSVTSISRVVTGSPPTLLVGAPQALGVSEMPYGQSLLTFVNMLLVAARVLGWPDEATLRAVLERG